MSTKITNNQMLWKKEINRLKRFMRQAEKKGYNFDFNLPEQPKRVTKKSIERLKEITPNVLYSQATYSGELLRHGEKSITANEARKRSRKKGAEKAKATRKSKQENIPWEEYEIIYRIEQKLNEWTIPFYWSAYWVELKTNHYNKVKEIWENAVETEGKKELAKRLKGKADIIERILDNVLYGSDEEEVKFNITEFMEILLNRNLTDEEYEDIEALNEEYEDFEEWF